MRPFALSPDDIRDRWPDFEPLLAALEHARGEPRVQAVREAALAHRMQIWGLRDDERNRVTAVTLTRTDATPGGKVCVILGAHSIEPARAHPLAHAELFNEILRWAAAIGCSSVRLLGRRSRLARLLRRPAPIVDEHRFLTPAAAPDPSSRRS